MPRTKNGSFQGRSQGGGLPDLVCLSHLRWNFVFQRPQHLMTRFAAHQRVFFVEEPVVSEGPARMEIRVEQEGVVVAVPHLPRAELDDARTNVSRQAQLLDELFAREGIDEHVLWYYTPMAMRFSAHLTPRAVVYDCMDELSCFAGAPPEMCRLEEQLLARADVVTTGGRSLFEAKQGRHPNVHCFPSSVDTAHFGRARSMADACPDQADLPRPRIGYAGVIDERMDLPLIPGVAAARPGWQIMMLGPVVKIDPKTLPVASNIHYLGMKPYAELPAYMAGWDVAMLPFARNESTRFISPTKTPEYLAAGRPVVSTSIRDVVRPYGDQKLVHIADDVAAFTAAVETALASDLSQLLRRADRFLEQGSWDHTAAEMMRLMREAAVGRRSVGSGAALAEA